MTLSEKEHTLVTVLFSVFHKVSCTIKKNCQFLFVKTLMSEQKWVNLFLTVQCIFTKCTKKSLQNIMRKGKERCYKKFLLFPECFQRSLSKFLEQMVCSCRLTFTLFHTIPTFNDPEEGDF